MTLLRRYNEILFALAGTLVLAGLIPLGIFVVGEITAKQREPGVAIATATTFAGPQVLSFCTPSWVKGSDFQYIPVAAVSQQDASRNPVLGSVSGTSYDRGFFENCTLGSRYGSDHVFNVVIRNTATDTQTLLVQKPAQIDSLRVPTEDCAKGEGDAPCGILIWGIREADTNGDGRISDEDALIAYVSDLSAKNLIAVTPAAAQALSIAWLPQSSEIVFQVRSDTNQDGTFSKEDGASLLSLRIGEQGPAGKLVSDEVMKRLQKAIE